MRDFDSTCIFFVVSYKSTIMDMQYSTCGYNAEGSFLCNDVKNMSLSCGGGSKEHSPMTFCPLKAPAPAPPAAEVKSEGRNFCNAVAGTTNNQTWKVVPYGEGSSSQYSPWSA